MQKDAGIDAYYDPHMFEDPWKDLLLPSEKTNTDEVQDTPIDSSNKLSDDGLGDAGVEEGSMEPEACSKEYKTSPPHSPSPLNSENTTKDSTAIQVT